MNVFLSQEGACRSRTRKATFSHYIMLLLRVSLNTPCWDCKTWTSLHPAVDAYLLWQNIISSWTGREYFLILMLEGFSCTSVKKNEGVWIIKEVWFDAVFQGEVEDWSVISFFFFFFFVRFHCCARHVFHNLLWVKNKISKFNMTGENVKVKTINEQGTLMEWV